MSRQTPIEQPSNPAPLVEQAATRPTTQETALALLQAMRPLQWTKNVLVFAALVFDRKFTDIGSVMTSIVAALCFCAASSTIYLINDVRDIERDQLHPRKRYRPIASGRITPRQALIAAAVLELFSIITAVLISPAFALVILGYLVLMVAYTLELKQIAIIDVFAISAGFVLRAAGGAIAASAGAIFHAAISSGKFQGSTSPTTPAGSLTISASAPSPVGATWPKLLSSSR